MSQSQRVGFELTDEPRRKKSSLQAYREIKDEREGAPSLHDDGRYTRMRSRHESDRPPAGYLGVVLPISEAFAQSTGQLETAEATALAKAHALVHLRLVAAYCRLAGTSLSEPWLGVGEDGSVGFDWRQDGRRLAVTFEARGGVEYYAKDALKEYEGRLSRPADHLVLISWLTMGQPFSGQQVDE